jgi:acrylyl-CoA reductase (NADPH)
MTARVPLEACIDVADRLIAGTVRGRVIVPISNEQ